MATIGRNAPCPCGSGRKFKKCCLNKPSAAQPKYRMMRAVHWSEEEIRTFPTEEIIRRLRGFGVRFSKEQFLEDVKKFHSACALADHWGALYTITAAGLDDDFIWMAAIVLWERLAPQVMNSERLDDMMQRGYKLVEAKRRREGCTLWLQVWEHLKERFTLDMKSIADAERVFSGLQCLSNWCQDLERELQPAGDEEASFYEKRIKYCREFCQLFPETDDLTLTNMRRAEAESYFALGRIEDGERLFEASVKELPNSAWGYIGWGDMYWLFRMNNAIPIDYEKAEKIYRMALAGNVDDRQAVLERLARLEKEREHGKGKAL